MNKPFLTFALTVTMASAWTCCAVSPTQKRAIFGTQINLVIWDAKTMTEHFVRDASFETEAKDLGFIAPSPTVPELADAKVEVFNVLESLKPPPPPNSDGATAASLGGVSKAAAAEVEVIQEADVAGYKATTLRASDPKALADWMTKNGYNTTPSIEAWTNFYIKKDWYLTAFKVKSTEGNASTGAVRMTFKTDKPFNPYLVPSDNRGGRNSGLELYYLGSGIAKGTIGEGGQAWKEPEWTNAVGAFPAGRIGELIGLPEGLPEGLQVTKFVDYSFPNNAADDLYFTEAKVQTEFPTMTGVAVGAGLGALVGVAIAISRRKKGLPS